MLSAAVALHLWLDTAHLQYALPRTNRPVTVAQAGVMPASPPVLLRAPDRISVETMLLTVEHVVSDPVRTLKAVAADAMSLARSASAVATSGVFAASPDLEDGMAARPALAVADPALAHPTAAPPTGSVPEMLPELIAAAAPLRPLERPLSVADTVLVVPRRIEHVVAAAPARVSKAADATARDTQVILDIVNEYSRAFERLDVQAVKAVSPSLDDRRLQRAFARLEAQELRFEACGVSIEGAAANARCLANASYRPKVGSRVIHLSGRQWTFNFSQSESGWQIVKTTIQ
jgi:hypothetical protein